MSCEPKKIDEDDFRDKFPYSLDEKPVEKEIKPPTPTTITIQTNNQGPLTIHNKQEPK